MMGKVDKDFFKVLDNSLDILYNGSTVKTELGCDLRKKRSKRMGTVELMKKLIETKDEYDKAVKHEKEVALTIERDNLIGYVGSCMKRINDMIDVANFAIEHGISLSNSGWGGHEGYDTGMFITNSWSHLLGFVRDKDEPIISIGINAGGACGNVSFRIDNDGFVYGKESTKDKYNKPIIEIVNPPLRYLQRFEKEFDEFEKSFYAYIEKKCMNKAPLVSYEIKI